MTKTRTKFTKKEKAFNYLWENGYRFLSDADMNSMENGSFEVRNGEVEGYTINGLKKLAKQGKFNLGGLDIKEDEVEMIFSFIKFMRQFKKK